MKFYGFDWHSPTHLFGSFFLVHLFHWIGFDLIMATTIAFILGVIWEGLDEILEGWWIFDPRGGDWTDVIVDFIGCGLAYIMVTFPL